LARVEAAGQDHRRDRLHRLHRHRQAVEEAGAEEGDAEAEEHARRRHARDGDRAKDERQERAEIAEGPAELAEEASLPALTSGDACHPFVA
jgi:hypothetical protein